MGAIIFSVSAHAIQIRNTDFTGADAAELPLLTAAGKRLQGQEYARSRVKEEEEHGFLPIYLERGHLKASFGAAQPKVVKTSDDETVVDITVPIQPGLQYKLNQIDWSGNSAFPTDQLQGFIHLKPGEVANAVLLDKDLTDVRRLYGTKGYMAPTITPKPKMQDADSSVRYTVEVQEGDIFRMGEIEIRGVDEKTRQKLLFNWRLKEGDTYDSGYIERFLASTFKELPPGIKWTVVPHEAVNDDRTVDVTLRYENGTEQ
jgi:outer membrane protein assembly factor BamA